MKTRGTTVAALSLYELGATACDEPPPPTSRSTSPGASPREREFSLAFRLSMAVVAISAPFLGHLADRRGKRRFLVPFVLAGVALTALVAAQGPSGASSPFSRSPTSRSSAHTFSTTRCCPTCPTRPIRRVSGYGVAAGYIGSLLAMVLVLPFVSLEAFGRECRPSGNLRRDFGARRFLRVSDAWVRRNAYLPTALLWLAAAVPLLFFARLPSRRDGEAARGPDPSSSSIRCPRPSDPCRRLPLSWFLVSNFLYIDVIHTIQIQMSAYSKFAVG